MDAGIGMPKRPHLRRIPPAILQRSRDLRHPLTPAETRLWQQVRDHKLGFHIRRQHALLGRFIADSYCSRAKLCIEIDGDTHGDPDQAEYDAARTEWLGEHDVRVMRFTNDDVMGDLPLVLVAIQRECGREDVD